MKKRSSLAPLILVFLGTVFLLNNFGFLPWSIWLSLWKFWPVLLILIGIEFFVGRAASLRTILILFLLIFIVPILLFFNPFGGNPLTTSKVGIEEPLGTSVRAKITADLPAVNLQIKALATDSAKLVSGSLSYSATNPNPVISKTDDKNVSFLTFRQDTSQQLPIIGSFKNSLNLSLSKLIPIDISLQSGASNLNLNLTGLTIDNLDIQTGAGNILIKYSASSSNKTYIKTAASNINLEIPKEAAARIKINGGPKSINIPKERFSVSGSVYQTKDYTNAKNKLDLEIEVGAASITVK